MILFIVVTVKSNPSRRLGSTKYEDLFPRGKFSQILFKTRRRRAQIVVKTYAGNKSQVIARTMRTESKGVSLRYYYRIQYY